MLAHRLTGSPTPLPLPGSLAASSPRVFRDRSTWLLVLSLPGLSGCFTLLPMQPASTAPAGTWRLGGQVAGAPWCSFSKDLPGQCADLPEGTPLPEVRLDARRGLDAVSDLGASVHASLSLPSGNGFGAWGARAGLGGDYKRVLWTGGPWLLSLAGGLGLSLVTTQPRSAPAPDLELVVPVRVGYLAAAHEWVAGLSVAERLRLRPAEVDPLLRVQPVTELGLTLGMYPRGDGHLALEVGYFAPVTRPGGGRFMAGLGVHWDLGGPPASLQEAGLPQALPEAGALR